MTADVIPMAVLEIAAMLADDPRYAHLTNEERLREAWRLYDSL